MIAAKRQHRIIVARSRSRGKIFLAYRRQFQFCRKKPASIRKKANEGLPFGSAGNDLASHDAV
ncbi:MAG: hypothetical protein D6741_11805, partial [Planctomycetota bacterium]